MRLNHVNLAVSDIAAARAFFETYFGLRCVADPGARIVILRDEGGLILSLSNFNKATEVAYPPGFHVGFIVETREQVDAMNRRFKDDGFDVKPPREFHGSWTFYMDAPGGFTLEVQAI